MKTRLRSMFVVYVLCWQWVAATSAFLLAGLLAPLLLRLSWSETRIVLSGGAGIVAIAIAASLLTTALTLRARSDALEALARRDTTPIKPQSLAQVAHLPTQIARRFFSSTAIACGLFLLPNIPSVSLDHPESLSLVALTITLLGASAIALYVVVRARATDLLEQSPLEISTQLLLDYEAAGIPPQRTIRKLELALGVPVALVGIGAVLIVHAHLRTALEQARKQSAEMLIESMAALEDASKNGQAEPTWFKDVGRHGYKASSVPLSEAETTRLDRDLSGQVTVKRPAIDHGLAITFRSSMPWAVSYGSVGLALVGLAVALGLGRRFGRLLADDLVLATARVRMLGTGSRATLADTEPPLFGSVAELQEAIQELSERFRVFAGAKKRALEKHEAAQRARGLLFASVSHDLKTPLNAILGFAELLAQEPLSSEQRESLDLIITRGRELLALIETILDAARVEAKQLRLYRRRTDVASLLNEALNKARELATDREFPITIELPSDLPPVNADLAYLSRAVGVIIAHAIRTARADGSARPLHVRAGSSGEPERIRIDVEHGSRQITAPELKALFARRSTSAGRGLPLGLSLARSVVELHEGAVSVATALDGRAVCNIWLPADASPESLPQSRRG